MYVLLSMIALALVALVQTALSPSTVEGYDDEESHRTHADAQDEMRRRQQHDHDVLLAHVNHWDDSDRHRHD